MASPSAILITPEEAKAIRSLKRLAKNWPKSLRLFSWSGTLCVTKRNSNDIDAMITHIEGIANDHRPRPPHDPPQRHRGQVPGR